MHSRTRDIRGGVYYKSWLASAFVSFQRAAALLLSCLSVSIPDRIIHQNRLDSRVVLEPPPPPSGSAIGKAQKEIACHKPWLIHYGIRDEYSLKAKSKMCYFMKMNER